MLSERIRAIKPSATLALASKAKALAAEGKDVISLTVGEPDWDTFDGVKLAGIEAIKSGKTKYMPTEGLLDLRKLIVQQTREETGINYEPAQVTVSTGGKFIIFSALQTLINPGDEVLIPAPYWVSYPDMVGLCGGNSKIIVCGDKEKFKLSAKRLSEALSPKTKAIILNSPSNPTGEVYSENELKEVSKVLLDHPQAFILSDDIYNRLYFNGEIAPHILKAEPRLKERVLVISGVSKSFAMTGWRLGWALGPKWWIDGMNIYQSQTVSCAASISQYAAIEALKTGVKEIPRVINVLKNRRDLLADLLSRVSGIEFKKPDGAFYFWINVSKYFNGSWQGKRIKGSEDFVRILLEDFLVASVDGASFGLEGYVRISYVLKDERLALAVDRIKKFVSEIV